MGFILPSKTNDPKDVEDGLKVATRLGVRHEVISIEAIVEAFKSTNPEALGRKYHRGDLTSEIRAVVLHTKAATENKLVIGTGSTRMKITGWRIIRCLATGQSTSAPLGTCPSGWSVKWPPTWDLMIWPAGFPRQLRRRSKPH